MEIPDPKGIVELAVAIIVVLVLVKYLALPLLFG